MNLGFDLDEVVVDLSSSTIRYINSEYGIDWKLEDFKTYDISETRFHHEDVINDEIVRELKVMLNDAEFQYNSIPIDGAAVAISKLKRAGHKIHFISARPKQNQSHTFKWLRQHNIPFDSIDIIGNDEKGLYGRKLELDMYVDDHLKHLNSMLSYKKRWKKGLIVFDRPWNSNYDGSKFVKAYSWADILRHVGVQNR